MNHNKLKDGLLIDACCISNRIKVMRSTLIAMPIQPHEGREYEEAMRCLTSAISSMAAAQTWITELGGNSSRALVEHLKPRAVRCE